MGGNLGGSLLGSLNQIHSNDWVVLELSSFMLEGLREDRWSPHIALVTNLSPNHLDWHLDFDAYFQAKSRIFHNGGEQVLNRDDPMTMAMQPSIRAQLSAGM